MNGSTRPARRSALALAAAAVLLLAACGSDGDGSDAAGTAAGSPAVTSPTATQSATSSGSPTASRTAKASRTPTATRTATKTKEQAPAPATTRTTATKTKQPAPATTKATRPKQTRTPRPATPAEPSLTVSKSSGLDPNGQTITVTGRNFDTTKGVYIALCAKVGGMPGNCGGGVDMTGSGGASAWVSSNPPGYAAGLPTPYGKGGTFRVTLKVKGELGDGTPCRTQCFIAARADHTRSSDRSQDMYVPVRFA